MNRLLFIAQKAQSSLCSSYRITPSKCFPAVPSAGGKLIVIMGPTGCGKTKLSVDLISRFFPTSEIINADKIQIYRGLDITTNKIPIHDRKNVRHHLLGDFSPSESRPEFTASDFRDSVSQIVSGASGVPFLVGGSNSYIYATVAMKFDPEIDVFDELNGGFCRELRYRCCFLWVDVCLPVLNQWLEKRVDEMLELGMWDELKQHFRNRGNTKYGLEKAIGVAEFEEFLSYDYDGGEDRAAYYEKAIRSIKENTCRLAENQRRKIVRLRDDGGWDLRKVDGTAALMAKMDGDGRLAAEVWETQVVKPSVKIVRDFLMG